ncbi:hypothetical protein RH831_10890 [Halodesulfurarchaeum sp. HSR-GB]|uniref:hypothetical protein n=1 Tax=Halodesulfurarchaeum sp. HSR-GB TaxID=3074077 RepID=UPI002864048A|nr:hypothetical protein [Halodesulfurarchaeum sp. HSR-GB]MDR5657682.1 hypothetical protein [Halodesulfurarchaeum sp. HSR-GB]
MSDREVQTNDQEDTEVGQPVSLNLTYREASILDAYVRTMFEADDNYDDYSKPMGSVLDKLEAQL